MYRKNFSKASEEWLWTDADQNDSFSDSSYLFPVLCILQMKLWQPELRLTQSSILGNSMKHICCWYDPIQVSFFGKTIALHDNAVIDCLIYMGTVGTNAVDHSPALNRPCLRAWTQLTYFLSFYH